MKLAHFADCHLGFRRYQRTTTGGANVRELDVARVFAECIAGIIAAKPDAVICAGDLFHSVRPPNTAVVFAFEQFSKLRQALPGIPIIIIAGNHDSPRSSDAGSILALFRTVADVVTAQATWLRYPERGLAVLAVPHPALAASRGDRTWRPDGDEPYKVLTLHGDVAGAVPAHYVTEYGGATVTRDAIGQAWSYVALGHYHVQHQAGPRCWYAGALDYVSPNLWGEVQDEGAKGVCGKGWLLVDLANGMVEVERVRQARPVYELDPIYASEMTAGEVDVELARSIEGVPGGITGAIVRLTVFGVSRTVGRALDHRAIRRWKSEALHLRLDLVRGDTALVTKPGATRLPLKDMVREYLQRRDLPPGMDRSAFVRAGLEAMDDYGS